MSNFSMYMNNEYHWITKMYSWLERVEAFFARFNKREGKMKVVSSTLLRHRTQIQSTCAFREQDWPTCSPISPCFPRRWEPERRRLCNVQSREARLWTRATNVESAKNWVKISFKRKNRYSFLDTFSIRCIKYSIWFLKTRRYMYQFRYNGHFYK